MPADALAGSAPGGAPGSVPGGVAGGATLAPATRALLREALDRECGHAVVAFVEQVTRQVAHPIGAAHDDAPPPAERERAVGARAAAIVRAACDGDAAAAAHAATLLADDVALLSAFFQNLDMLPTGDAAGDAVAILVLEAMGRLGGG